MTEQSRTDHDKLPRATVEQKRSVWYWAWIIPAIALLICIYVIWVYVIDIGTTITVEFLNGHSLKTKAPVKYRGVQVGTVKSVELNKDMSNVIVTVLLDKSADKLAVKGSSFWIVHAEVGLGGFSGLDTVLGEQYLSVTPGSGPFQSHFVGLVEPPAEPDDETALTIIIEGKEGGSLKSGSPIEYRHMRIGAISSVKLSATGQKVEIECAIRGRYAHLVRGNSKFWNTSGIGVDLSLFGAKVKTESLSSLLTGGIGMVTPNTPGPQVQDGARFELSDSLDKSWLKWSPNLELSKDQPATDHGDQPPKPLPTRHQDSF